MNSQNEHIQRIETIERELERLQQAVFGNGEPGIRTNLAVLVEQHKTVDRRLGRIESGLGKVTWLAIASVVSALLKLVLK